jgi:putative DNA primase/helicase
MPGDSIPHEQVGHHSLLSLRPADLEMFHRLGITDDLLVQGQIERVTDAEAREKFGITGSATEDMSGIVYPYFSPESGWRSSARVRRDYPPMDSEGKPIKKYVAAWGDTRRAYYPPGAKELLADASVPIVLVEAEKSVLAFIAWAKREGRRLLVLGMGGCYGWRTRKRKRNEKGKLVDAHEELFDLNYCAHREIFILLDANVAENGDVQRAEKALIAALHRRDAKVRRCRLPKIEGVNGPDDFIGGATDEAMAKVLDSARTVARRGQPNGQCPAGERREQPMGDGDPPPIETLPEGSESYFAHRFTAAEKDDLRYTAAWHQWHGWAGYRWQEDSTLNVFTRVRKLLEAEVPQCFLTPAQMRAVCSAKTVAGVEHLLRYDARHTARVEQWDADLRLLGTVNGTVDLITGELREPRRADYITRATAVSPEGGCPLWLSFLRRVTENNEELMAFLQRMAGYCLTGLISEEAFFFLYGTGANGKGTFVDTLSGIMSDYARNSPIETFLESRTDRHPTELAYLCGARLVTVTETKDGRRWDESKLKAMTGGDPITARFMHGNFFQYKPQFKLLISGNYRPGLKNVDEAIRRRLHLVPFTVTIPEAERDQQLKEKLRAEWPGILAWAIAGCLEWQRIGLASPEAVREATTEYLEAEDALGRWIEECCWMNDPSVFTKSAALFASWKGWAEANGEQVGTQKRFSVSLAAKPRITKDRIESARGFYGIKLKNPYTAQGVG